MTVIYDCDFIENQVCGGDLLESFTVMNRHVTDLEGRNGMLEEDLAKREEALKRLRELTLGQKATAP